MNKRGITLIALIITIIVMLILVGVTINVALNGGLIDKAKTAGEQTQIEADKESLLMAALGCMGTDGTIVFTGDNGLDSNLPEGFSVVTRGAGVYSKGGYTFTVNAETGEITVKKSGSTPTPSPTPVASEDLDYLETFFLGAKDETTGERPKNISFVTVCDTENGMVFTTDTNIKYGGLDGQEGASSYDAYVRYNGNAYKVVLDTSNFNSTSVTQVGTNLPTKVGKFVKFSGSNDLWVVLYDEGETINNETLTGAQLISANTLEEDNVYLGYNDGQIDWTDNAVITAANIFSSSDGESDDLTNVEKSIYSYNNAITTLNAKCTTLARTKTGKTNIEARSVGSNPVSKNSETSTNSQLSQLESWPTNDSTYPVKSFYNKGKDTDTNYETDYERLKEIAYMALDNLADYWLASRVVELNSASSDVVFRIRCVSEGEGLSSIGLWDVGSSGAYYDYRSRGVRPVVSLGSKVLSNATGSGTASDPYVIQQKIKVENVAKKDYVLLGYNYIKIG